MLLTDNHTVSLADQAATAAILLLVLLMTLTVLLSANSNHRIIGKTGAGVIGRVMGIALAIFAADAVPSGFDENRTIEVTQSATINP